MSALQSQLLNGEQILWEGKPYAGLILRPIEFFLIPFSALWGGFALFWNIEAATGEADIGFQLFGLPFVVMGLYITVGRFILDIYLRRNAHYAVTNKRILIQKGIRSAKTTSLEIRFLPALEMTERADGSGTIRFGPAASWFFGNNFGIWQPSLDPTPQFIRVEHVRYVYGLIQKQSSE